MPSKYDSINKIKKENPNLTWTQAAHKAGFSGEWTSSKGKAKPRTGNAAGQARRRALFDQPSTELAAYKAKILKKETSKLSAEAEMFGLEPFQVEHLADQDDIQNLISGSGGDPNNLLKVRQSDARLKDRIKQILTNDYAVTIDPSAESYRVIPKKFFDPIADPSTLPGFNISVNEASELVQKGGAVKFKAAGSVLPLVGVAAGVMRAGQAFAAGDPQEGTARLLETGAGEVPIVGDVVQPEAVAGGTFEDVQRRTAEGLRAKELQQRAAEARQRGGKLSFGFGGVRFALPEFGLSELMGIN